MINVVEQSNKQEGVLFEEDVLSLDTSEGDMVGVADIKKRKFGMLQLSDIHVKEGWNERKDYGDLEGLKNSIIENGVQQPIKGYVSEIGGVEKFVLTDGYRRVTAVRMAHDEGCTEILIPALPEARGSNEVDHLFTQLISNDGKPFEPIELAGVFKRLLNYGLTESQIAKRMGRSVTYVNNYLDLLEASPEVIKMVEEGKVSHSTAVKTIQDYGNSATAVLEKAVEIAETNGKSRASGKHIEAAVSDFPVDENGQLTLDQTEYVEPGKSPKAKKEKKILPAVDRVSVKAMKQAVEDFLVEASTIKPESPENLDSWTVTVSREYLAALVKIAGLETSFPDVVQ